MVFAKVDLRLGRVLLGGGVEEHDRLLQVALDAKPVAVHDAKAVGRLAVALQHKG